MILVIADTHEDFTYFDRAMDKYGAQASRIIHLGDWFDSFQTPKDPTRCLECVQRIKACAADPRFTRILGNHDAHYRWGGKFRCSGWTAEKHEAIQNAMTQELWDGFEVWARAGKWVLSHAGITSNWLTENTDGYVADTAWLDKLSGEALALAHTGRVAGFFAAGKARGGWGKPGPLWTDWDWEFQPVRGVCQIVGHTPHSTPKHKGYNYPAEDKNAGIVYSENWCIDTNQRFVGIIGEDGEFRTEVV